MVSPAMKLKDACSLEKKRHKLWWNKHLHQSIFGVISYDKPRHHIKKKRRPFANKALYSKSYGSSSSRVQMWELDYKEGWVPKNWCFRIVVLEKTCVNPKGIQSWIFIGRTDTEAPILWPSDEKSQLIRKDPDVEKDRRQEEKGTTEVGWHHQLKGHEFEHALQDDEE